MENHFRHIFGARPRFAVMKHEMMKAVIFESYGGPEVLRVVDVAKPIPAMNEMLVTFHATTITSATADSEAWTCRMGSDSSPARCSESPNPGLGFWEVNSQEKSSR